MQEMAGMLRALAHARLEISKTKDGIRRLEDELRQSSNYHKLTQELESAQNVEKMYDQEIRKLAVKHPEQLPDGVTVKNFKEAVIESLEEARIWCFENFRPALKLDEKVFKGAIKDGIIPTRIGRIVEEKRAQIATNLSDYEV